MVRTCLHEALRFLLILFLKRSSGLRLAVKPLVGWHETSFCVCFLRNIFPFLRPSRGECRMRETGWHWFLLACLRHVALVLYTHSKQNKTSNQPISRPTTAKHSSPPNHSTVHQQPNGRTHDFRHWFDAGTCHFRFHKGY